MAVPIPRGSCCLPADREPPAQLPTYSGAPNSLPCWLSSLTLSHADHQSATSPQTRLPGVCWSSWHRGRGLGLSATCSLSEAPTHTIDTIKGGFPIPPDIAVPPSVPRAGVWGAEVERGRGDLENGDI